MSESDLSGRLPRPRIAFERRPLSNNASTASCNMRFSLRRMTSGARCRISFCRRLLRLITRRYKSFRSDVAKRPPSNGTSGRRSGGITGMTSRIIHSGLLRTPPASPDPRNASTILRRFSICFFRCCDVSTPNCVRADVGLERVVVFRLRLLAQIQKFILVEQLVRFDFLRARLDDDVVRVIHDLLEITERDVEQIAHGARQRLEEPDVRDGYGELDVPHALATDARQGDFDAATIADHAAITDALVLAAMALPVLYGTKNALAEQAILLGLE